MSVSIQETEGSPGFDVFISHASEDKDYVGPLVAALESADIEVWFDEVNLAWGDDLRSAIDRGLAACRYGIVVFSKAFLSKKKWTEYELNALFALETPGQKRILPIWHNVNRDDLVRYSPAFADRIAKISATHSYPDIVKSLRAMLGRSASLTGQIRPSSTSAALKPSLPRPNPIAYAWYETQGESALKAQSYVRESPANRGRFTYDNSFGHEQLGTKEEIAMLFAGFDKSLTVKGYIRKHWANLSGDPIFNL